jgi:tripartite ATP-independent transporter DctP family solute receptor
MTEIKRRTLLRGALGGVLAAPALVRTALGDTAAHSMKLGFADVASSPYRKLLDEFAESVRNRTNGAVDIKVYAAGELGSQNNILTGMQVGVVDFAAHTTGFIQTLFPRIAVLDFPYVFTDRAVAERVVDGGVGDQIFSDMPAKGIYGLSWIHWGWRPITTVDREVPKPADMKGLRIRLQPGAIYAAIYKTLGAVPVSIDVSEIYIALSQHAVDALEVPAISLVAGKYYEVAKVLNLTGAVYNAGALMTSKRRFDALEATQQSAIRDAARELSTKWRDKTVTLTEESIRLVKDKGNKVITVDDEAYRAATRPVYDEFRGSIGADLVDSVLKQAGRA